MESGHGSGADTYSKAHPTTSTSGEAERTLVSSQSFTSTSSSDNFDDTFELNDYDIGTSTAEPSIPTKPETNAGNGSRLSDGASTTQSPPTQVMERPGESPPAPSAYQIPSSVFNTSKSSHTEWSTASNESLFSIHMGAMSFNKDALLMMGNGEQGLPPDYNMSSPLVDHSSNQPPPSPLSTKPHDPTRRSGNLGGGGVGATEAVSAQTMKEVIRENEENRRKQQSQAPTTPSNNTLQHSGVSSVSVQSFAFDPISTKEKEKRQNGGAGKDASQSPSGTNSKSQPQSDTNSKSQPQAAKKPKSQPQSGNKASAKASAKAEAPPKQQNPKSTQKKWFPCFSCCWFCP